MEIPLIVASVLIFGLILVLKTRKHARRSHFEFRRDSTDETPPKRPR